MLENNFVWNHPPLFCIFLARRESGLDVVRVFIYKNDIALPWAAQCEEHWHITKSLNARIYKILYFDNAKPILILSVSGNRYYLNVGRPHPRNNIFCEINISELIHRNVMTTRAKTTSLLLPVFLLTCFSQHRKSERIMFKSGFQYDF